MENYYTLSGNQEGVASCYRIAEDSEGVISMWVFQRGLHSSRSVLARTRYTKPKPKPPRRSKVRAPTQTTHHDTDLKVTAPIPPAAANLECNPEHPLWQFFDGGRFMRSAEELDDKSRPWTVPELRRKSFDDLHSLWYACLKERNILAREMHLRRNMQEEGSAHAQLDERVRTTMWRIRHVLSERDWAYRLAHAELGTQQAPLLREVEEAFLAVPEAEDGEAFDMLARLQRAVFGISEYIEENLVDRRFVDGLKYIATLKLRRFAPRDAAVEQLLQASEGGITDAGEAFVIFTAENTLADVKEAADAVNELREQGNKVDRYEEIATVAQYLKKLANAKKVAA
ncbi:AER126Wp [Eremothecium gossypii ATCC 10895]|uniref:Large ribosomal subunit protein uL29m n=1 Tax=Eremothecium gossypii (strain ATCC 10895 / CBS 109.51 / FGSC 9923 / NRRL Y-1056) TaxID=284811 RepID=RM04_EREGS|nr:mitochondrial 54S ribosomal protein YmL4 [Eremothecium gossypii ATCC 10895]Q756Y8.3 RecName: Full=Large ribosomal subunit protein uL29m; AltName: Full=54S ribosomal protein L4, mitochondrial; Flags: Precursor [Eremothecium gossypii ATCC 10895]AAS52809.2 AER126Wp [Eremothecium gossypii ATCC 10895]AEY97115.1 FAER126Wp [Eremothecium gossypii FDAG1]